MEDQTSHGTMIIAKSQSGSALAISLVILTAITLISISSLQRSGLQAKIVANIQHQEQLFNAAQSDQELWVTAFNQSVSGDNLLAAPLRKFTINPLGEKEFSAVDLPSDAANEHINLDSNVLHIPTPNPPPPGHIALSSGEEAGQRINYRFTLNSSASIPAKNRFKNQQTGLSFPGLNPSLHTLN